LTRRRVLLLSYEFAPFRGGIARVTEGLAAGAAASGHDVHVLAPDYFADQTAADGDLPFDVHRFSGDFCSILSLDKLTRFTLLCSQTISRIRPDVVHAADPQSQMALTALSRFRLAPDYSFTIHGTEILRSCNEAFPRLWMRNAMRVLSAPPLMEAALARVPALETAGIRTLIHGPDSFTPDGNFILGEAPETPGFFVGAGFNAYFVSKVCDSAYYLYRERLLAAKYGHEMIHAPVEPAEDLNPDFGDEDERGKAEG